MSVRVKQSVAWPVPVRVALLFGLCLPAQLFAYGSTGHLIVGAIAEQQVCAETAVRVAEILDGESLGKAGLWADTIRGDRSWDYAKPWHYINVPDGATVATAGRNPDGDVLAAIAEMNQRLRDPSLSQEQQAVALKFLVHFVADVHQPLHVGRSEDRGGNLIAVVFVPADGQGLERSNLHRYWDRDALAMVPGARRSRAFATALLADMSPLDPAWTPGEPAGWAAESQAWRPEVYGFAPAGAEGSPVLLDSDYQAQAAAIIQQRLTLAGLRLAAQLDALYCAAPAAAGGKKSPANSP